MGLKEQIDEGSTLQEAIEKRRAEIKTDAYAMSVGELISLYQNNEIDIHPEFQRFFRWSPSQKSRLIESILLGIPIPQIFVAQRADGVWDVVDGLQRLGTIFEFAGILRDENKQLIPPLVLEGTKYLPALENKKWEDAYDQESSFTSAQRLYVKRAKIGLSIIQYESDEMTKFELFQRLNTGGSQLSDQEVRNCILVMENRGMWEWMRTLPRIESFRECTSLTDRALEEQYDLELVLRFMVLRQIEEDKLKNIKDLGEFLTDRMIVLAKSRSFDRAAETDIFEKTFSLLQSSTGQDSFRRYDAQRSKFLGGFSVSAYEIITTGIAYNYDELSRSSVDIGGRIRDVWANQEFTRNSGTGVSASSRIPRTIPLGRRLFQP